MARLVLVSFAGYPYTPSSLMPDNGLANLAGALLAAGHDACVLDYGTVETMARLYPRSVHRRMAPSVRRMLAGGSMRWRDAVRAVRSDLQLARHQRKVYAEIADEVLRHADDLGADGVGFKLWNGDGFLGSVQIAERIRRRRPALKLFAGGPQVDWFKAGIFDYTDVFDALVAGEGEGAIVPLAEHAAGERPVQDVPNVFYRSGGKTHWTICHRIDDLDTLPMPCYRPEVYRSLAGDRQIKLVTLDESRGCPGHCAFCLHGKKSGRQWRFKSALRVVEELQAVGAELGTHAFVYAGSNTPARAAAANAQAILDNGLDVRYACFAHVKAIAAVDLRLLARSGCRAIFLGLESASPRVLSEAMHKDIPLDKARDLLARMRQAKIASIASVIYPAPFEDAESRRQTIDFLLATRPDSVPVQIPGLIPGTMWEAQAEHFGFAFPGGTDRARRKGLTYKIKLMYPPKLWPKLPYTLHGKTSRQLASETGRFIRELEQAGLTTGVGHDLTLMAAEIGQDLRTFRDEARAIFLSGDVDRAGELVARLNAAMLQGRGLAAPRRTAPAGDLLPRAASRAGAAP